MDGASSILPGLARGGFIFVIMLSPLLFRFLVEATSRALSWYCENRLPKRKYDKAASDLFWTVCWLSVFIAYLFLISEFADRWGHEQRFSQSFQDTFNYGFAAVVGYHLYQMIILDARDVTSGAFMTLHHVGLIAAAGCLYVGVFEYGFLYIYGLVTSLEWVPPLALVYYHLGRDPARKLTLLRFSLTYTVVVCLATNAVVAAYLVQHWRFLTLTQKWLYPIVCTLFWLPEQIYWGTVWWNMVIRRLDLTGLAKSGSAGAVVAASMEDSDDMKAPAGDAKLDLESGQKQ